MVHLWTTELEKISVPPHFPQKMEGNVYCDFETCDNSTKSRFPLLSQTL